MTFDVLNPGIQDRLILTISIIGLVVCCYYLFLVEPKYSLMEGERVGIIITKTSARRRQQGSLSWNEIKNKEPIFQNDVIYTGRSGIQVVLKDKGTIDVEPNSMLQLDTFEKNDVQITLISGAIKTADPTIKVIQKKDMIQNKILKLPTQSARLLTYLADPMNLESEYSSLTQRLNEVAFRQLVITRISDIVTKVDKLEHLDDYEIRLRKPTPNVILSVRNRPWIEFSWTLCPLEGVRYTLEVAREANFKRLLAYPTEKHRLLLQFFDEAKYFWRVKVVHRDASIVSEMGRFTLSKKGGMSHPVLDRIPSSIPKGFATEVAKDVHFSTIIKSEINSQPNCSTIELSTGNYFCRVRSLQGTKMQKTYSFAVK